MAIVDICAEITWLVKGRIGLSLEKRSADCIGTMITDVGIAVHAARMGVRIWRHARAAKSNAGAGFTTAFFVATNVLWVFEGALFWLRLARKRQPGPEWFQSWFELLCG